MKKIPIKTYVLILTAVVFFTLKGYSTGSRCSDIFNRKCTKCHPVPSPLGYSKALWDDYVERMAKSAKLTADEKKCIKDLNSTIIPE